MKKVFMTLLIVALAFTAFAQGAKENEWPTKSVEAYIPANPGGDTDTTLRNLSEVLREESGIDVQLVTMTGAAGAIANQELLDQPADGYHGLWHRYDTVLLTMKDMISPRYDEYLDVAATISVTGGEYCVLVNKNDKRFNTFEDFVAYCKKNPGKTVWAVEGHGWNHLFAAYLCKQVGIEVNFVEYGSQADRIAALLGGTIDCVMAFYKYERQYPDDIKALCICAEKRQDVCPHVPTMLELGYDVVSKENFYFFAFPAKTDKAIVNKMGKAIESALKSQVWADTMALYDYNSYQVYLGKDAMDYLRDFESKYVDYIPTIMGNLENLKK